MLLKHPVSYHHWSNLESTIQGDFADKYQQKSVEPKLKNKLAQQVVISIPESQSLLPFVDEIVITFRLTSLAVET